MEHLTAEELKWNTNLHVDVFAYAKIAEISPNALRRQEGLDNRKTRVQAVSIFAKAKTLE